MIINVYVGFAKRPGRQGLGIFAVRDPFCAAAGGTTQPRRINTGEPHYEAPRVRTAGSSK